MDEYPDRTYADRDACAELFGASRSEGRLARVRQTLHWITVNLWWWLRQVSGDADYENYMRRGGAISAEEFYLENLRRKYSRINRCC